MRDYDPQTGRYIQSDPIGLRGGLNSYIYGDANPLIAIDIFGLKCIRIHNPGYPQATPTGKLRYGKLINSERINKYGLAVFEICYRTWVRNSYQMEELYQVKDSFYLKCWDDCGNYEGSLGGGKEEWEEWEEWRPARTKSEDSDPSAWICPKRDPYGPTPPDFPDLDDLNKNHPPTASP